MTDNNVHDTNNKKSDSKAPESAKFWSLFNFFKKTKPEEKPSLKTEVTTPAPTPSIVKPAMLMYDKSEMVETKADIHEKTTNPDIEVASQGGRTGGLTAPCPKPNVRPEHAPPFTMERMSKAVEAPLADSLGPSAASTATKTMPTTGNKATTTKAFMSRTGSLAARVALAGTIIWWTYDLGIWGDAHTTEKLWSDTKRVLFNQAPKNVMMTRSQALTTPTTLAGPP